MSLKPERFTIRCEDEFSIIERAIKLLLKNTDGMSMKEEMRTIQLYHKIAKSRKTHG